MANITNAQKKEWAKLIYLKDNLTQKEIAAKVGVTEKTLGRWVSVGQWEQLKSSVITTKSEELRRLYMQINELNDLIFSRPKGERFATTREADTLAKITLSARNLETETSVADVIDVFRKFIGWLRAIDLDKAKEIVELQDAFIKTLMNR